MLDLYIQSATNAKTTLFHYMKKGYDACHRDGQ